MKCKYSGDVAPKLWASTGKHSAIGVVAQSTVPGFVLGVGFAAQSKGVEAAGDILSTNHYAHPPLLFIACGPWPPWPIPAEAHRAATPSPRAWTLCLRRWCPPGFCSRRSSARLRRPAPVAGGHGDPAATPSHLHCARLLSPSAAPSRWCGRSASGGIHWPRRPPCPRHRPCGTSRDDCPLLRCAPPAERTARWGSVTSG